jgi:hypothetical protein
VGAAGPIYAEARRDRALPALHGLGSSRTRDCRTAAGRTYRASGAHGILQDRRSGAGVQPGRRPGRHVAAGSAPWVCCVGTGRSTANGRTSSRSSDCPMTRQEDDAPKSAAGPIFEDHGTSQQQHRPVLLPSGSGQARQRRPARPRPRRLLRQRVPWSPSARSCAVLRRRLVGSGDAGGGPGRRSCRDGRFGSGSVQSDAS